MAKPKNKKQEKCLFTKKKFSRIDKDLQTS